MKVVRASKGKEDIQHIPVEYMTFYGIGRERARGHNEDKMSRVVRKIKTHDLERKEEGKVLRQKRHREGEWDLFSPANST